MDEETIATLKEYNDQLKKVNEALIVTESIEDRNNLISLKNDLQQLIALTNLTNDQNDGNDDNESKIDDEYAMFMAEMEKEGAYKGGSLTEKTGQSQSGSCDNNEVERDFSSLEGTKCKAPHCHMWGLTLHHNALIATVLPQEAESAEELRVKVLFINPTHKEMLPCPYYLESECRFSEAKCRFSHGEIVKFADLQEYAEPDFAGLVVGSAVLAKQEDKLWHKAIVRRILKDKEKCIVKLERSKAEMEVDFVDLLPVDAEKGSLSEDESGDDEAMDEEARDDFINMSLLIEPSDDKLGSWEKYTKGIGSKLMEKMGYVIGTGLGRRGEGRVDPVTAVALPAGKSLDHCMQLREKSGGDKNLFNVERKLKRQARRQEARNQKNYERETKKVDVFNFLNDTLAAKQANAKDTSIQLSKSQHRKEIKAESSRNLNVESFKIEQRVKEIQAELVQIRQAMQRQSASQGALYKQLRDKYSAKEDELKGFQNKAVNIKNEQSLRNTTRQLTKF